MCGIFCIVSDKSVKDKITEGLKFLEYRGYDSAGIALLEENNELICIKALGRVNYLTKKVRQLNIDSTIGVGHTRWATHGKVTIENTHPIHNKNIAVVHNGIIENNKEIKNNLTKQNYTFKGETDTEVILNLLQHYIDENYNIFEALKNTIWKLKGNFAIAVLYTQNKKTIYCAKNKSPLVLGFDDKTSYIASDINALRLFVNKIIPLEDREIAIISQNTHKIFNFNNKEVKRNIKKIIRIKPINKLTGFSHYMLKEINEQPQIIKNIFNDIISKGRDSNTIDIDWKILTKVSIIACGSSYNAGMVAKYWFESYAKISTEIDFASEFRVRDVIYDPNTIYIFISQSGETLDTLIALKEAKKNNAKTIALVNTLESSIANLADYIIPIQAGVEISVASTKTFAAQLMKLANIVLLAAVQKKLQSTTDYLNMMQTLSVELSNLTNILAINQTIIEISQKIINAKNITFLGRHSMYPIALEGALKLKELSYLPVFSSAAGELKHGPIALIDNESLVIALAPKNNTYHKMTANIEEVQARGAKVVLFTDPEETPTRMYNVEHIYVMPKVPDILVPLFYTIPLQLIAYQVALKLGKNIDRPRNLAKSVTVE